MIKNLDYEKYDYLTVSVKTESSNALVLYYGEFLWQEIERNEDKRYDDVIHVTFCRAHKLANKDRLQYLQVCLEAELNKIGMQKRKMRSKKKFAGFTNDKINAICEEARALTSTLL